MALAEAASVAAAIGCDWPASTPAPSKSCSTPCFSKLLSAAGSLATLSWAGCSATIIFSSFSFLWDSCTTRSSIVPLVTSL